MKAFLLVRRTPRKITIALGATEKSTAISPRMPQDARTPPKTGTRPSYAYIIEKEL